MLSYTERGGPSNVHTSDLSETSPVLLSIRTEPIECPNSLCIGSKQSQSPPSSCPQATPRPVPAFCRQPDGLDELSVPNCVARYPHMQEAHYLDNMRGSMPPKQPHNIQEHGAHQYHSAGQAVPVAQFAASQGHSYEDHQEPPGLQNLQPLGCSEGQLQAEEGEGMWVEGDSLNHHRGMMNLQFYFAVASCCQACSTGLNLSNQLCKQKLKHYCRPPLSSIYAGSCKSDNRQHFAKLLQA